jgi:hypothetical protein
MKSKRLLSIGLVLLACAAATWLTLAKASELQAAAPDPFVMKFRAGGPVPLPAGKEVAAAGVVDAGRQDAQAQGDPPWLVLHTWVWQCNPAAVLVAWSPQPLCEDFVVLR